MFRVRWDRIHKKQWMSMSDERLWDTKPEAEAALYTRKKIYDARDECAMNEHQTQNWRIEEV